MMFPEMSTVEPNSRQRPGEGERGAGQHRGQQVRQDDPAEDGEPRGAERRRTLLHLLVELDQHRLHRAHHERERHEQQRDDDTGLLVGDVDAERAVRPVEREQDQARDDRRQRERQVDQDVEDLLAGEESRTSTQAISVPKTRLSSADDQARDDGQLQGRPGVREW